MFTFAIVSCLGTQWRVAHKFTHSQEGGKWGHMGNDAFESL